MFSRFRFAFPGLQKCRSFALSCYILKRHEMFPLWAKLILILSILLIPTNVCSSGGGDLDVLANNSRSYEGCIPVLSNSNPADCKKLFYCVAANTSQFRIPILAYIKFSLVGDCKSLLKNISSSLFKIKVSMTGRPPEEKGTRIKKKGETYIVHWQGGYTSVDLIKTFKNYKIYIFLPWAAVGTVALPTYSIYLGCKIDQLPSNCAQQNVISLGEYLDSKLRKT